MAAGPAGPVSLRGKPSRFSSTARRVSTRTGKQCASITSNSKVGSVLLAAGRGERLRPLTDLVPKPALPLLDVPLAAYALPRLVAAAPAVVVNLSHLPEVAERALNPWLGSAGAETLIEHPAPFGSGGTLAELRERIGRRVLTWNCDALTDLDPAELLGHHHSAGAPATVAVSRVDRGADFELVGGRVSAFIDRREEPNAPGYAFMGIAIFETSALSLLPETKPIGLTESLLHPLVERGEVGAFEHDGYWLDVGTPNRYLRASLDLMAGYAPMPPGGWPGEIVEVGGAGGDARGRAYVGPNVTLEGDIGPGAGLLAGSRVPSDARVERAIVWPGETVSPGTKLKDAIWAGGGSVPAHRQ